MSVKYSGPLASKPRARAWSPQLVGRVVLACAAVTAMSVLASRSLNSLSKETEWGTHSEQVRFELARVLQLLTDIETGARGYALSSDARFLEPYQAAVPLLVPELARVAGMVADSSSQRARAERLRAVALQRVSHADRVVERSRANDAAGARSLVGDGEGKRLMDDARGIVAQMQAEEERLLALRQSARARAVTGGAVAVWTAGALAIVLLVLLIRVTVRDGARLHRTQEELAATLRSVGDAVISTDAAGTVRFMNAVAERLTGWSAVEARGQPLAAVFHIINEQTRAPADSPVPRVIRERRVVAAANHTVLIARDGTELAIENSAAPILGAGDELQGVVLVFRNAGDERETRRALEASEERFRGAVEAVHGVLWTNSATGEMLGEQPAWGALTGQSREEYQGFGWSNAVHPADSQPSIDAWLEAVRERRPFVYEHRVRRHDGEWGHFSVQATPLFDAHGAVREWVGVHTDITEQRKAERQLRASEARFWAMQDTSVDGFMLFESVRDDTGAIVDFAWSHVNEAAARIVGRTRSWFKGRRLLEEMPGARVEGLFDGYVGVVSTGVSWSHEFAYRHEGLDLYVRLVAAKSEDGFAVTFADLTERRRQEEQVRESAQRFQALADAMPQLVWTCDAAGINDFFNSRWYAFTGLSEEEGRGAATWRAAVYPDDAERVTSRWTAALASGEPFEVELRLRRHDGAYRWFLARASVDRNAQYEPVRWYGTFTDIDATKRTEANLRATEAALREADVRKDVFLATLSHELRNPLAPIRMAARLLESPNLGQAELDRGRSIISRQVGHMASLLDDLLDISRITRGALVLKKEYVSLQSVIDTALETARPQIESKRHQVNIEIPAETIRLEADPLRLTQVVGNLLTNAAKYTDPEGTLTVGARVETESLVIFVRDTGIGIRPEMLSTIFEMFTQAERGADRSEGGLGIGLALVKGLVELHGGRVEARSAGLDRGSEFVVALPKSIVGEWSALSARPEGNGAAAATTGRRVLVADDNRDGADSLGLVLELAGHEVHLAHTGPEALDVAQAHRPDFVILDIGMPGMTGYEVATRIRREAWGTRAVIVAVTGWGQEDDRRAAYAAGFDYHLTKPLDPDELDRLLRAGRPPSPASS